MCRVGLLMGCHLLLGQVDIQTEDDEGFSSFSDTDDEQPAARAGLEQMGAVAEMQAWNSGSNADGPSGELQSSHVGCCYCSSAAQRLAQTERKPIPSQVF